jgi:hypothetical protein
VFAAYQLQMDRRDQHGGAAMVKKKRHSRVEIATKLAQANDLATQGKLQSEIARTLGVSVMPCTGGAKRRLGLSLYTRWVRSMGRAAGATELLNSSSKIYGCGDW